MSSFKLKKKPVDRVTPKTVEVYDDSLAAVVASVQVKPCNIHGVDWHIQYAAETDNLTAMDKGRANNGKDRDSILIGERAFRKTFIDHYVVSAKLLDENDQLVSVSKEDLLEVFMDEDIQNIRETIMGYAIRQANFYAKNVAEKKGA